MHNNVTDYPWCGATPGYVRSIPNGGTILHLPIVFFTDKISFLRQSNGQVGRQLAEFVVGLAGGNLGTLGAAADVQGRSRAEQAERFTEMLAKIVEERQAPNLTSADILEAFGDFAEAWPNTKVVKATLRKKGLLIKDLDVTLVPDSGLRRGGETPDELGRHDERGAPEGLRVEAPRRSVTSAQTPATAALDHGPAPLSAIV